MGVKEKLLFEITDHEKAMAKADLKDIMREVLRLKKRLMKLSEKESEIAELIDNGDYEAAMDLSRKVIHKKQLYNQR